jgi:hypothetical protein
LLLYIPIDIFQDHTQSFQFVHCKSNIVGRTLDQAAECFQLFDALCHLNCKRHNRKGARNDAKGFRHVVGDDTDVGDEEGKKQMRRSRFEVVFSSALHLISPATWHGVQVEPMKHP